MWTSRFPSKLPRWFPQRDSERKNPAGNHKYVGSLSNEVPPESLAVISPARGVGMEGVGGSGGAAGQHLISNTTAISVPLLRRAMEKVAAAPRLDGRPQTSELILHTPHRQTLFVVSS